jgi:hypothetical protein
MKLDYLITGTGRCGTVYCAKYLSAAGIPCGHEAIFDYKGLTAALSRLNGTEPVTLSDASQMRVYPDGTITRLKAYVDASQLRAESSYLAAPYLQHDCLKNTQIVHVVRHPIAVIQSFCYYLNYFSYHMPCPWNKITRRYENFIYVIFPELMNPALLQVERGAMYYILWNRMIQDKLKNRNHFFLKIEDAAEKLGEFIGCPAPEIPKDENTFYKKNCPQFSPDDLSSRHVRSELEVYAKELGYKL